MSPVRPSCAPLLVLALLAALACATAPPAPIRPLVPPVAETASQRERDGLRGPVRSVTTWVDGQFSSLREYDERGQLTRELDPSAETTVFFDERGRERERLRKLAPKSDGSPGGPPERIRLVSAYDERGRLATLSRYEDEATAPAVVTTYRYDQAGRLAEEEGRIGVRTVLTTYRYDARGRLVEKWNQRSSQRFDYDPRGQLSREAVYVATDDPPSLHAELCGSPTVLDEPGRPRLHLDTCHVYQHDDLGYRLRDVQYDREGRPRTVCRRYNEHGDVVRRDTRASDDCGWALTWFIDSATYTHRLEYDQAGNWIADLAVSERGSLKSSTRYESRWERTLVYDQE